LPDGAGYPQPNRDIDPNYEELIFAQARADAWVDRLTKWGQRGWEIVAIAQENCAQAD